MKNRPTGPMRIPIWFLRMLNYGLNKLLKVLVHANVCVEGSDGRIEMRRGSGLIGGEAEVQPQAGQIVGGGGLGSFVFINKYYCHPCRGKVM